MNARIRQLLQDLQSSLSRALAGSEDVSRALEEIREEGWSLYLVLDRQDEEPEAGAPLRLTARHELTEGEPIFKIDGRDLGFLRSVGIDPTRKLRPRKSD